MVQMKGAMTSVITKKRKLNFFYYIISRSNSTGPLLFLHVKANAIKAHPQLKCPKGDEELKEQEQE